MKCLTAALIILLVNGCASTNVIDAEWDDPAVHETIARTAYPAVPVVKTDGRFWRYLLIGSAVGASSGAIIGALLWKRPEPCACSGFGCIRCEINLKPRSRGDSAAIGAVLGAAGGSLIGAIVAEVTRQEFVVRPGPNRPAHDLKIIVSVSPP